MLGNPFMNLPEPTGGAPLPPGLRGGTLPLTLTRGPVFTSGGGVIPGGGTVTVTPGGGVTPVTPGSGQSPTPATPAGPAPLVFPIQTPGGVITEGQFNAMSPAQQQALRTSLGL